MTSSRPSSLTVERADPMTRCPTTCLKDQTTNTIVESGYASKAKLEIKRPRFWSLPFMS